MARIIFDKVGLSYPVYGANSRSLKRRLVEVATGGRIADQSGSSLEIRALNDISFELHDGDRLGLVGHNGSGKSSLLRVMAGIYRPQQGHLRVRGSVTSILDVSLGMDPEATGYENIYLRGLLYGLSKAESEKLIPEIEDFTELGNFLSMPVKTYSSGMMLRLAFALSTSITPDILVIDEVIGTGDAAFMNKANERIERFIDKSSVLVLTSHNPQVIQKFCSKVIWLEHGSIRWSGPASELMNVYG